MSNKRRVTIIVISVLTGSILSFFILKLKRGGAPLTANDQVMLITNFSFAIAIILGVGFFFLWNKKKDL